MGGWGSGPYGPMGDRIRKSTVEETMHIHIKKIKDCLDENKVLTYSWYGGKANINIINKGDYLFLLYKVKEESIKTRVNLEKTKVGFGERVWFECPCCANRTARLYLVKKEFFCRDCHNLTYLTCQESGDPLDYLYLKIRRLQRKLGLENPSVEETPLFKPKHMHQKTFDRLRFKLVWLQEKRGREFIRQCGARFNIY